MYGYYGNHGGFARHLSGKQGIKYRKTLHKQFDAPQGLTEDTNFEIDNPENNVNGPAKPTNHGVDELINEISIGGRPNNEEERIKSIRPVGVDFAQDARAGGAVMAVMESPAAAAGIQLKGVQNEAVVRIRT